MRFPDRFPLHMQTLQEDDILMEDFVHPLLERFSVAKERCSDAVLVVSHQLNQGIREPVC